MVALTLDKLFHAKKAGLTLFRLKIEYRPGLVMQWPREVSHSVRRVQHSLVKSLTISKRVTRDLVAERPHFRMHGQRSAEKLRKMHV